MIILYFFLRKLLFIIKKLKLILEIKCIFVKKYVLNILIYFILMI